MYCWSTWAAYWHPYIIIQRALTVLRVGCLPLKVEPGRYSSLKLPSMKDIVNCATWRLRIKHTFCYTAIVSEPLELLFEQKYSIQPRFYLLRQYSKTSIRTALQRTHAKGIHDTCTGSLFYTNHMHLQNIYVFSNHTIYMLSMQLDDFLCPLLYIHRYILACIVVDVSVHY